VDYGIRGRLNSIISHYVDCLHYGDMYLSNWHLMHLDYAHASIASRLHISFLVFNICLLWMCFHQSPKRGRL
jgi:hypothetical protein